MSKALERQQAKGIRWNTAMSVLTFLAQFVALYFLNKMISPEDFGKVVWAAGALLIGNALSNLSFVMVGIREKEITQSKINAIFFLALVTNVTLFLLFFFVIPYLPFQAAQFSAPFLKAFSFLFLAKSFRAIPFIKLQRNLQFDRLSTLQLISKVLSLGSAIFFAVKGNFFWALFFLYGGLQIINSILIAFATPWKITTAIDFDFLKKRLGLGASFTAHQLVGSISSSLGTLLIGNIYGQQPVGEYHKSFGYKSLPIVHIASPIAQVMFPTFSKLQDQSKALSNFFLKAQNLTSFMLLPVFFLLFAVAEPFATLYFNENWNIDRITILLQIFSIAGSISIFYPNFYSFFSVVSKSKELNSIVITQRVLTILGILATYKISITAVAASILVTEVLGLSINVFFGKKYFYRAQLKNMVGIFLKTLVLSVLAAFLGFAFYDYLPVMGTPVVHFLLACITSGLFYLGTSFFFNNKGFAIFKETFFNK